MVNICKLCRPLIEDDGTEEGQDVSMIEGVLVAEIDDGEEETVDGDEEYDWPADVSDTVISDTYCYS